MRTLLRLAMGALLLAIGLLAGRALGGPAAAPAAAIAPPAAATALTVQVVAPEMRTWAAEVRADGDLAPWQEAVVGAGIGGLRIVRLGAEAGDAVRRGQVLVELDQVAAAAALAAQEAEVGQMRAAVEQASADVQRVEAAGGDAVFTAQQALVYRIAERSARGRLAAAEAQLALRRNDLAQTVITAPDDGVVVNRSAQLGQVVALGGELMRLVRQNRIEWRAAVTAADLAAIAPGQAAEIRLPDGSRGQGMVSRIDPLLGSAARTALVHVELPAGTSGRIGMFASGTIRTGTGSAHPTVPEAALLVRDGRRLALVVVGGRIVERPVAVLAQRDGRAAVDGLGADDRVVAEGAAFLAAGDAVRVVPAGAPERP